MLSVQVHPEDKHVASERAKKTGMVANIRKSLNGSKESTPVGSKASTPLHSAR